MAAGADGITPLRIAITNGDKIAIDLLGKAIAKKESDKDYKETTSLLKASAEGDAKVVSVLLTSGADKNKPDKDGRTPLFVAAKNGHIAVVDLLLRAGADGIATLRMAITNGHLDVVDLLGKAIVRKENDKDYKGITSLYKASAEGDPRVVNVARIRQIK